MGHDPMARYRACAQKPDGYLQNRQLLVPQIHCFQKVGIIFCTCPAAHRQLLLGNSGLGCRVVLVWFLQGYAAQPCSQLQRPIFENLPGALSGPALTQVSPNPPRLLFSLPFSHQLSRCLVFASSNSASSHISPILVSSHPTALLETLSKISTPFPLTTSKSTVQSRDLT